MDKELDVRLEEMYKNNQHKEIIEIVEAMNESERDFDVILHYGRALLNDGKYEKAKEVLLAVESDGADIATWNYRVGYAYYSLEDYEKAFEYCFRSIELDKKSVWSYVLVAWCYIDTNNLDDALIYINKAEEIKPNDEEIVNLKNYTLGRLWYTFALGFYKKFAEELNFNFDALSYLEKEIVVMFIIEFIMYKIPKEDGDILMLYQVIYHEYETVKSLYKELGAFETLKIMEDYYSIIKKYFENSVIEEDKPESVHKLSTEDKNRLLLLEKQYTADDEDVRARTSRAYRYYKNDLNLQP